MKTVLVVKVARPYSVGKFLGDCFMTAITGGLWLGWVAIR
jgi:hypothetical protein